MKDLGPLQVAILFVIGLFILHSPLLFQSGALQRDIVLQSFPWLHFQQQCLQDGRLPTWNPYLASGYPQGSDPQSQAWYPFHLLLKWLPPLTETTLRVFLFLHYGLAAFFFYLLCRKLSTSRLAGSMCALAYCSSGFFLGHGEHYSWIVGQCWLTALLLFTNRFLQNKRHKELVLASLSFSLIILGGYPGLAAASALLLFLYLLFAQGKLLITAAQTTIVLLLASTCAAILLIQLAVIAQYMTRSSMSLEFCLMNAFPLKGFLSLFTPLASQEATLLGTDYCTASIAIGFIPLMLFLFGLSKVKWQNKTPILLFTIFLLLSLGKWGGLRTAAYYIIPFFNRFRFPALFRGTAILFALLIAAQGFDHWKERADQPIAPSLKALFLITLVLSLLTLAWGFPWKVCLNGLFSVILGLLFIFALRRKATALIIVLLLIDLSIVTNSYYQGILIADDYRLRPASQIRKMHAQKWTPSSFTVQDNVSSPLFSGLVNHSLFSRTLRSTAYNPFQYRAQRELFDLDEKAPVLHRPLFSTTRAYDLKEGNCSLTTPEQEKRRLVASATMQEELNFSLQEIDRWSTFLCEVEFQEAAAKDCALHLFFQRTKKWPENAADHCVMKVTKGDKRAQTRIPARRLTKLRFYLQEGFSPKSFELKSYRLWVLSPQARHKCLSFNPTEMVFQVNLKHKALAVLRQSSLPGWQVQLNNQKAQLLTVERAFIGCEVPQGKHEIRFSYRSPHLSLGLALTLIGWLASLSYIFFLDMKKWRPKPPLSD